MSDIPDQPPDENEEFESLDEALDDEDAYGGAFRSTPEGDRDLNASIVVDEAELEEAGANLDDPERMSMLDGGIDDPDGSGVTTEVDPDEEGWDVDPVTASLRERSDATGRTITYPGDAEESGADGDAVSDDSLLDVPDLADDPELEIISVADLDEIPDDAPGSDSARW